MGWVIVFIIKKLIETCFSLNIYKEDIWRLWIGKVDQINDNPIIQRKRKLKKIINKNIRKDLVYMVTLT